MSEVRIRVDPDEGTDKQAENAVKKMRGKLMFGKAKQMTGSFHIPYAYTSLTPIMKKSGMKESAWDETGTTFLFSLTKHDLENLQAILNKTTNGDYGFKLDNEITSDDVVS